MNTELRPFEMFFISFYNLKMLITNERSIGTKEVKITPEKNAIIDISEELLLFIMGSNVSIDVAPATETDSNPPILLATIGIVIIAKTSLKILLKKAILPSSVLIFESSIAEREYHPSPEETARECPKEIGMKSVAIAPPTKEPIIVVKGRIHIFFPYFFKFIKRCELSLISIPTKNKSKHKPKSIKKLDFKIKKSDLKKIPQIIPKNIDIKIPSIPFTSYYNITFLKPLFSLFCCQIIIFLHYFSFNISLNIC